MKSFFTKKRTTAGPAAATSTSSPSSTAAVRSKGPATVPTSAIVPVAARLPRGNATTAAATAAPPAASASPARGGGSGSSSSSSVDESSSDDDEFRTDAELDEALHNAWVSHISGRRLIRPGFVIGLAMFHRWFSPKKGNSKGLSLPFMLRLFEMMSLTSMEADLEPTMVEAPMCSLPRPVSVAGSSHGAFPLHDGPCYQMMSVAPSVLQSSLNALSAVFCGHPAHFNLDAKRGQPFLVTDAHRSAIDADVELALACGLLGDVHATQVFLRVKGTPQLAAYVMLGAAREGHAPILAYILTLRMTGSVETYLNIKDPAGFTALHYAARNNDAMSCRVLLTLGASADVRSGLKNQPLQRTPFDWAVVAASDDVCYLFVDALRPSKKRDCTVAALLAVRHGRYTLLEELYQKGWLDSATKHHCLLTAAAVGCRQTVRLLVQSGEVNVNYLMSPIKRTPLHYACLNRHPEIVEFLLEAGADSSLTDARRSTAFHLAAAAGSTEVIGALLKYHAEFHSLKDSDGNTPSKVAEKCGHSAIAATLNAPVGKR